MMKLKSKLNPENVCYDSVYHLQTKMISAERFKSRMRCLGPLQDIEFESMSVVYLRSVEAGRTSALGALLNFFLFFLWLRS